MLEDTIRFIEENRLIAIVRGIAPKKCLKVADALYEGGFRLVEVIQPEGARFVPYNSGCDRGDRGKV